MRGPSRGELREEEGGPMKRRYGLEGGALVRADNKGDKTRQGFDHNKGALWVPDLNGATIQGDQLNAVGLKNFEEDGGDGV